MQCPNGVQYLSRPELFKQIHQHTDVRLVLGWLGVFVAGATGLYGYKVEFEQSKPVVWTGLVLCVAFVFLRLHAITLLHELPTSYSQLLRRLTLPVPDISSSPLPKRCTPTSSKATSFLLGSAKRSPNEYGVFLLYMLLLTGFHLQIETERITLSSRTIPVSFSQKHAPASTIPPQYALSLSYVRSTSANKSLLAKGKTQAQVPYTRFFDSEGTMDAEVFERWVGELVEEGMGSGEKST